MNSINQNYLNNYDLNHNKIGFKADSQNDAQPVQIPDLYYTPEYKGKPKTFKEKVKQWDILGLVYQWLEHPLLMLGTCAGLSFCIDAIDKSFNRNYEKSSLGRAAKLGDKVEKSKIVQSEPVQKGLKGIKKGWGKVKSTAMKSNIVKSMVETPSEPEWEMPKSELKKDEHRIVSKFKELAGEVGLTGPFADNEGSMFKMKSAKKAKLTYKDLYLNKEEIANLKKIYGDNLAKAPQEELVNRVMLHRVGKTEADIAEIISKGNVAAAVKEELFKASGLTKEELAMIINDQNGETSELVKKASKNLKNIRINNGNIKLPGSYQPFANISSFEGIYNRLHSMTIGEGGGAETKTGRFMSKALQKFHRGFTWGGGKTMVLFFVGPMILEAFLNTKKADKKEKVGTLASGIIEPTTWVITFPLVLKAIYAYGGVQYAGMGKEKVAEYRKLIQEFNEKADAKEFKDKAAYKTARKELDKKLKALRNVENQNLFTMGMRKLSYWTKWDLERIKPYQNENAFGNVIRKVPNFIKGFHGFPGRFCVFMLAGMPILDKAIKKILDVIFGKSYDAMKEEEYKDKKEQQNIYSVNDLRTRLEEAQRKKLYPEPKVQTETESTKSYKNINPKKSQKVSEEKKTTSAQILNQSIADTKSESSADLHKESSVKEKTNERVENRIHADNAKQHKSDNKKANKRQTLSDSNVNKKAEGNSKNKINKNNKPENTINKNNDKTKQNQNKSSQKSDTKGAPVIQNNSQQRQITNQVRDNYTYIPSQDSVFNQDNSFAEGKYIPSQTAANINTAFDNSGLDSVLHKADLAEQKAINVLNGNFDVMQN